MVNKRTETLFQTEAIARGNHQCCVMVYFHTVPPIQVTELKKKGRGLKKPKYKLCNLNTGWDRIACEVAVPLTGIFFSQSEPPL